MIDIFIPDIIIVCKYFWLVAPCPNCRRSGEKRKKWDEIGQSFFPFSSSWNSSPPPPSSPPTEVVASPAALEQQQHNIIIKHFPFGYFPFHSQQLWITPRATNSIFIFGLQWRRTNTPPKKDLAKEKEKRSRRGQFCRDLIQKIRRRNG